MGHLMHIAGIGLLVVAGIVVLGVGGIVVAITTSKTNIFQ